MRSWSVTRFGEKLERLDRATPAPKGTEVLVRVSRCGVCHSDVHIWQGFYDMGGGQRLNVADRGVTLPLTMGHEAYGEIVAVGPEGDRSAIGKTGVVFPWTGCGTCPACRAGDEHLCLTPRSMGVFRDGGYGDHVLAPSARHVVPMPGIEPGLAATYACSGLTALGALDKAKPYGPGARLVVIGAGGLGLMAVSLLKAEGATDFTVVDLDDRKLAAARALGAPETVNASAPDVAAQLAAHGPVGAVVDFVGSEATSALALGALKKGGAYVVVGLYGGQLRLPLPSIPWRALRIEGSYVGNLATLERLAALVSGGKVAPIPVETRAWEAASQTLDDLAHGRITGRVVLAVDEG